MGGGGATSRASGQTRNAEPPAAQPSTSRENLLEELGNLRARYRAHGGSNPAIIQRIEQMQSEILRAGEEDAAFLASPRGSLPPFQAIAPPAATPVGPYPYPPAPGAFPNPYMPTQGLPPSYMSTQALPTPFMSTQAAPTHFMSTHRHNSDHGPFSTTFGALSGGWGDYSSMAGSYQGIPPSGAVQQQQQIWQVRQIDVLMPVSTGCCGCCHCG